MACEGHLDCCHCHCGECVCCDPYTSKACEDCQDCIHTTRIPRPKPLWQAWRDCRRHQYTTYAYQNEPAQRICIRCGAPEPTPLDVAAMKGE